MGGSGCAICGREGHGVRDWGIVMPEGTRARIRLCSPHSAPLRELALKGIRERRVIGVAGLDDLADPEG